MEELQETKKAEGLVIPPLDIEKRIVAAIHRALRFGRVAIFFALALAAITASRGKMAHAMETPVRIDLNAIAMIESSGNPKAVSHDGSIGLFQITPVLLMEYNALTRSNVRQAELFRPEVSRKIADWYLHKRIPAMLRHFKKPVTVRTVLISWNAGINVVKKGTKIPSITSLFLKKYNKIFCA